MGAYDGGGWSCCALEGLPVNPTLGGFTPVEHHMDEVATHPQVQPQMSTETLGASADAPETPRVSSRPHTVPTSPGSRATGPCACCVLRPRFNPTRKCSSPKTHIMVSTFTPSGLVSPHGPHHMAQPHAHTHTRVQTRIHTCTHTSTHARTQGPCVRGSQQEDVWRKG